MYPVVRLMEFISAAVISVNQSCNTNNINHFSVSLLKSVYGVKEGKQLGTLVVRR